MREHSTTMTTEQPPATRTANPAVRAADFTPKTVGPGLALLIGTSVAFSAIQSYFGWKNSDPMMALSATLLIELTVLYWAFRVRPGGLPLAFYTISCFTFLTARIAVVSITGFERHATAPWGLHVPSASIAVSVLMLIQVYLLSIWVTTSGLLWYASTRHRTRPLIAQAQSHATVAGLVSMLVGAPLYIQNRWEVVGSVASAGYTEFYLSGSEMVSVTGRLGDSLLIVGFTVLLASMPRWRTYLLASFILVSCHGLDLVMGRRADFVLTVLLVAFYPLYRASITVIRRDTVMKWPKFRTLVLLSLLAIPFIQLLNFISNTRGESAAEETSTDAPPVLKFFYDQGVTANILGYLISDDFDIPDNRVYTFGPLIEFVQVRLIPGFDDSLYASQTADRALEGYSFADTISYLIMPTGYENGMGYGSSAVAELFWDFGLVGVIAGGAVIGALLVLASRIHEMPVYVGALVLLVFRDLTYTPRAPFLYWLVGALNVYNIIAFLLIMLMGWVIRDSQLSRGTSSLQPGRATALAR